MKYGITILFVLLTLTLSACSAHNPDTLTIPHLLGIQDATSPEECVEHQVNVQNIEAQILGAWLTVETSEAGAEKVKAFKEWQSLNSRLEVEEAYADMTCSKRKKP